MQGIVSDDRRWQWSGQGGGAGSQKDQEVFRRLEEERQTGRDDTTGQVNDRTGHNIVDDLIPRTLTSLTLRDHAN